ncbi:Wadjet anti-phage system protein JetD domain-containing protein [Desulfotomaculum copahuensis]|uniref:Wadjet anti-phage system protein JetD domain-containing protein n=1 Tax=Desulfotomaculum copahuensis TaxID=1838280 RepID=UPI001248CF82|nr:Wadjet anti-phage system protein JetD domain-containing protein [Desulfotomaculum copahuensis]
MDYAHFIMETLLDKHERRDPAGVKDGKRRLWFHFNRRTMPAYFDDTTARYKEEINSVALALQRQGLIEIRWVKYEENNLIGKVALQAERLPDVYALLGRHPRAAQLTTLAGLARHYARGAAPWAQDFLHTAACRLEAGEPTGYFQPERGQAERLFKVIREIGLLPEEVPCRIFSLRVLGDSKAFNSLAGTVARIIRDFHPDWGGAGRENRPEMDAGEIKQVLAEMGVVDNPQHIFISGGLDFDTGERLVRVSDFFPDLGLPAEMVDRLTVKNVTADYVLTVENLTSFYQFIKNRRDNFLAVYLGGYHNLLRRRFLSKLKAFLDGTGRAVPFYHWGDIDYGGFSIFVHLQKRCLPGLKPLFMDVPTLERYRRFASPFTAAYGRRLRILLKDADYRIFHPVITKMLQEGVRLEQECVDSSDMLAGCRTTVNGRIPS